MNPGKWLLAPEFLRDLDVPARSKLFQVSRQITPHVFVRVN